MDLVANAFITVIWGKVRPLGAPLDSRAIKSLAKIFYMRNEQELVE